MKKTSKIIVCLLLIVSTIVAMLEVYKTIRYYTAEYPDNNINGYVAWGAGGSTDTLSRTLSIYAAKELGTNIIIQNKTGASGSVATEYVKRQDSNGYSILFNSENPPLYKVMGLSNVDYDDFYPVILIGQQVAVLVVSADSSYDSLEDLFEDARANPGKINFATTGAGGLPSNVAAMMESTSGVSFKQVPYDGDTSALTALLGGYADLSVINYSVAADYVMNGSVKILTVFANERLESLPYVAAISEIYPEYSSYFPWGAFVGVYVDIDCSDNVKETLTNAFRTGWENEEYQQFLSDNYIMPLGLSGDDANAYIKKFQQITTWLLYDSGQTDYCPDEFGIPRLEEEQES
ncbi:MAG: tripartite tricarboxylate transporter substrate binding protein [Coprococcus sp.]